MRVTSRPTVFTLYCCLFFTILLLYGSTLHYPFFFDDQHTIEKNHLIQTTANWGRLWVSNRFYSMRPDMWGYRPLMTFLNSLAWLTAGGETWPFRVQKMFAFAGVCTLLASVWKVIWTMPGFYPGTPTQLEFKVANQRRIWEATPATAALALAFVFAIHPANTEVMDYIASSSSLFTGLAYLAAYRLYLRYRSSPTLGVLLLSCLCYALAVLTKEEGITFPAVVLLSEVLFPKVLTAKNRFKMFGAYFVTAALLLLLLRLMYEPSSEWARGSISAWNYFMTQWRAYFHYFLLLFWPKLLNADNLSFGFSLQLFDCKVILALIGNLFVFGAAIFNWRKRPLITFAVLWFYLTISPASSIVPLAEPVNDRRMFIAYFGLLGLIFPYFLKALQSIFKPAFSGLAAMLVIFLLVFSTLERNQVWASQLSLWTDTLNKNPDSPRSMNNLATVYMADAKWDQALGLLRKCQEVSASYSLCSTNQAVILAATGKDEEAKKYFEQGILADSRNVENHRIYGAFLQERGFFKEAISQYLFIDTLAAGGDLNAIISLLQCYQLLDQGLRAKELYQRAQIRFGGTPELEAIKSRF